MPKDLKADRATGGLESTGVIRSVLPLPKKTYSAVGRVSSARAVAQFGKSGLSVQPPCSSRPALVFQHTESRLLVPTRGVTA
jgi:hypothetical protein